MWGQRSEGREGDVRYRHDACSRRTRRRGLGLRLELGFGGVPARVLEENTAERAGGAQHGAERVVGLALLDRLGGPCRPRVEDAVPVVVVRGSGAGEWCDGRWEGEDGVRWVA
jgi:hypothetical protein